VPEVPLALTVERGVGTRVEHGEGPSATGLLPGDVITRAGATEAPTPAHVRQLLAGSTASGWTTMVVRRAGRQHVVAVPVAARSDAAAR
jgi:S1-C subfamily serine protease